MNSKLFGALLLLFHIGLHFGTPMAKASWTRHRDAELGYQGAYRLDGGRFTRNRFYGILRGKTLWESDDPETPSQFSIQSSVRGFLDPTDYDELSIRALNLNWTRDHFSITVGAQEVAWGETFGFFISDLVNPRNLRDPLFNELNWIREPTTIINTQFFLGKLNLQFILTPVPRNNDFPESIDGISVLEPREFSLDRPIQDAEYGIRAGYLFDSGFDLSTFYFRHWNRNPVFTPRISNGELVLDPIVERTHSFGASFSQTLSDWVFRGDTVLHVDMPLPEQRTVSQSILGTDFRTEDGWSLGAQYHLDLWANEQRHWIGTRFEKPFFRDHLVPEIFFFRGINNADFWIQPQITWNILDPLTFSLRADLILNSIDSSKKGYLTSLKDEDRILAWLAFRF